jgi:isopentenyl diphosphate isomerase/L-lactate dehydrogenase-like FMN-dependent dehydrogenase
MMRMNPSNPKSLDDGRRKDLLELFHLERSPLTSVAHARRVAKRRLPRAIYSFIEGGLESELTARGNVQAFDQIYLRPRVGQTPLSRDQSVQVLGENLDMPVLIAPTGYVRLANRGGELAAAKAAHSAGTGIGISTLCSYPMEEVVRANPRTYFQLYFTGERKAIELMVDRAKAAGCKGIILTLDYVASRRSRDRDARRNPTPVKVDAFLALKYGPQMLLKPGWLASFLRDGLELTVPNVLDANTGTAVSVGEALTFRSRVPQPSWSDVEWIKHRFDGPVIVKGIMTGSDARHAKDAGASAIVVSNHGGYGIDGAAPTIFTLPEVVEAVGDEIDVLMDGGVRRGVDVVKAIAMGAKAVLIGRPYIWGLAAGGEQGVREVLGVLRQGIDDSLGALGCSSLAQLTPDDLTSIPAAAFR